MRRSKEKRSLYMGIDIGSTSTEAVVLDEHHKIVTQQIMDTDPNHKTCTDKILTLVDRELAKIYNEPITREDIQYCVGTGCGRENIHCAGKTVTEISCHAKGVRYYFPTVRTVIDMGGQDSKVIRIADGGEVLDFVMNEKCAAGTGQFIEAVSEICEVSLDEMGDISLQAEFETGISSMCTVFAESEIISKLAEGAGKEPVIKGLHAAIAFRVLTMGKRIGINPPLVFTGGVAKNIGMVRELLDRTGFKKKELLVPPDPQFTGALGAALSAVEEYNKQRSQKATVLVSDNGTSQAKLAKITSELEKEIPVNTSQIKDKPVIGWTDLAVPVELLSAANINHIRITGEIGKGDSSDQYIRTYSCAYIKNAISAIMEKSKAYDFIEGIVTTNCCNATERMFDVLRCQNNSHKNENGDLFVYPLTVPRLTTNEAIDYMSTNLVALKEFLQEKYDTPVTEEKLRTACEKYNKAKRLMQDYTTLLARNHFPDTARLIAFQLDQLWRLMEVNEDFTADIMRKINILKEMIPLEKQGPNILLAGSIIPGSKFYDIFDNIQCHIVYNHTSSGNKFAEALVDLDETDIYKALARRCLYPGYGPRTMDPHSRMTHINQLIRQFNVDGIIFNITKFCVYYTFEAVLLRKYCERWNIPLLIIETDFTSKGIEQLKTRIDAFIETFEKNYQ
jgi:predicted CoA-substrate-specific enzyme activase